MQRLLLVTVLALGAGAAQADSGFFYLGAGISKDRLRDITNLNASNTRAVFADINNTSWKVLAGFRPISLLAVEADYLDLGSQTGGFISRNGAGRADAKAFAAYGVGFLPNPVPFLDLYGKVGLARWQLNGSGGVSPPGTGIQLISFSDRGNEFAWGVGAQVHVGNIGARLEYESFNIPNTSGARVISLAAIVSL
jgi:Outer membrane protein beta-barrel domain